MGNKDLFVERRPQGDFAVRRANSERASAVAPTQAKAIAEAQRLEPTQRCWWSAFAILVLGSRIGGASRNASRRIGASCFPSRRCGDWLHIARENIVEFPDLKGDIWGEIIAVQFA